MNAKQLKILKGRSVSTEEVFGEECMSPVAMDLQALERWGGVAEEEGGGMNKLWAAIKGKGSYPCDVGGEALGQLEVLRHIQVHFDINGD